MSRARTESLILADFLVTLGETEPGPWELDDLLERAAIWAECLGVSSGDWEEVLQDSRDLGAD